MMIGILIKMKYSPRNQPGHLLCICLIAIMIGCQNSAPPETNNTIDPEILRVVSLSPNITQIIFELGADDLLVGVDDYSVYPEAAQDIPSMGNYLDPDIESLIIADPEIVFVLDTDEGISDDLVSLGIKVEPLGNDTIDDIGASYLRLGELLGREDEAETLFNRLSVTITEVTSKLDSVEPKTVALIVGRNPGRLQDIYVAGGGNFLGELLAIAGGANVFADEPIPWPQVGAESLIGTNPDVIIDSTLAKGASDEEYNSLLTDWNDLPTLTALKNERIIIAKDGWFQIPGAHLDSILLLFAHWLHPEIFPDKPEDPNL